MGALRQLFSSKGNKKQDESALTAAKGGIVESSSDYVSGALGAVGVGGGGSRRSKNKSVVMQRLRSKVKNGLLSIELSEELNSNISPELATKVLH